MEVLEPVQYITLDPGATTGWACWRPVSCKFKVGHISDEKVWWLLDHARDEYELEGPIIVEKFLYRQGLPKIDFRPIEVIGVVKEWARQNDWHIIWQTPAEGKFYFTDARLKEMGLYLPGKKHGMDALRHLLYYRKLFDYGQTREENKARENNYQAGQSNV